MSLQGLQAMTFGQLIIFYTETLPANKRSDKTAL
jgi:hypothetical protein